MHTKTKTKQNKKQNNGRYIKQSTNGHQPKLPGGGGGIKCILKVPKHSSMINIDWLFISEIKQEGQLSFVNSFCYTYLYKKKTGRPSLRPF